MVYLYTIEVNEYYIGQRYDSSQQKWQGSCVHERFDLGLNITISINRQPPGKSMHLVMIVKVNIIVQYVLHLPLPNTCASHNVRTLSSPGICILRNLPLAFGVQLKFAQALAGTAPT